MTDASRDGGKRRRRRAEERPTTARRRPRRPAPAPSRAEEDAKRRGRRKEIDASEEGIDSAGAITVAPLTGDIASSAAIEVEPIRRGTGKGKKKRDTEREARREARRTARRERRREPVLKAVTDEILFGKIALDCGYIDQKTIDQCIATQKSSDGRHFLGEILMSEGYLERDEVNEIIALQNKNLRKRYSFTGQPKENSLFGALVVAHGYATREQVNEVVRLQAEIERFDERLSLGELLVECGYLDEAEVKEILALQKKREYRCYKCREIFTISLYEFGQKIRCPHCRQVLVLPETAESRKVKLATSVPVDRPVAIDEVEAIEDSVIRDIADSAPNLIGPVRDPESGDDGETSQAPVEIEKATGWFVGLGGQIFGPQKLDILRKLIASEIFNRHDLFWHESMEDWQLACEIPELAGLFPKPPPLPGGSAPGSPPRVQKDSDLEDIVGRLADLRERGTLGENEYQEIRRLLLGD